MPNIVLSSDTASRLALLARAWSVSDDAAVARLLDHFAAGSDEQARSASADKVAKVVAMYRGERVEGKYYVTSGRLDITAGPCAGRSFKTPSGAAIAVVQTLNPRVNPNRNGWSFWALADTGETLQSLRDRR